MNRMVKLPMFRVYSDRGRLGIRRCPVGFMNSFISKNNKSALFDELISIEMHIWTARNRQIFGSNASNLSLLLLKITEYRERQEMSVTPGEKHEKLWGGRFTSEASALLWKYNASIGLDKEGFRNDV